MHIVLTVLLGIYKSKLASNLSVQFATKQSTFALCQNPENLAKLDLRGKSEV